MTEIIDFVVEQWVTGLTSFAVGLITMLVISHKRK